MQAHTCQACAARCAALAMTRFGVASGKKPWQALIESGHCRKALGQASATPSGPAGANPEGFLTIGRGFIQRNGFPESGFDASTLLC
jgi:hypothetical protein